MRIYIESTIPSYVVARPARDLLQAARQQLTKDWWDLKRSKPAPPVPWVALLVFEEGEYTLLRGIPLLEANALANELGRVILRSGLLPGSADGDAAHIALATVHEMDILLTWNCRHIANVAIHQRLRQLAEQHGYILPSLATPEEFMSDL